jgi:activator of HSP90 ATPase
MTPVIQQRVRFNVAPARLFDLYMNSRQHSAATRARAVVSKQVGGKFSAFDGTIAGRLLAIVPNRLIVQSWRSKHWKETELDSILVLTVSETRRGGQIDLVHVNVPAHDHDGVSNGWEKYYWKPWRTYLEQGPRKATAT